MRYLLDALVALILTVAQFAAAAEYTDSASVNRSKVVEMPDIKVDDYWVYKRKDLNNGEEQGTFRLDAIIVTDTNVVLRSGKREENATRELNMIDRKFDNKLIMKLEPSQAFLKFPLEVGKKWDGAWVTSSLSNGTETRVTGNGEVEAIETVTVPAGTFQAYRVKFQGSTHTRAITAGGRGGTLLVTRWYVPSVKRWIKELREDYMPAIGNNGVYQSRVSTELLTCSQNCRKPN